MSQESDDQQLLRLAAERAIGYAATVEDRGAGVTAEAVAGLARFNEPLPEHPGSAAETIELLADVGGPATMATTGSNYFGFVNGGTLPVALAASFIASAWDQNAALPVMSPVAAHLNPVVRSWVVDLLGLPETTELALVTGATVANASCLAAARDALLANAGWDVQQDGLFGAPPIEVVVGGQVHTTVAKSLGLIGLGRNRVTVVPSDDQGRLSEAGLAGLDLAADRPTILCAQAGEVNTGAFDPFPAAVDWCRSRPNTWLHVDGAFGLWALADPTRRELVGGLTEADSWATDGHKWLNVTYDCGLALVARPGALRQTFAAVADYLPPTGGADGAEIYEAMHHTPQSSQRARQVEVWAALRTLGRSGVAELVQRACDSAQVMAERLTDAGFEILNDVVLNQVLVRFVDGPTTERLLAEIHRDGRVWCGPTVWGGATAIRISVSSWRTTPTSAADAADVIVELANGLAEVNTDPLDASR